jgi:hypothetical protein
VWSRVVPVTIERCERACSWQIPTGRQTPILKSSGARAAFKSAHIVHARLASRTVEKPLKRTAHLLFYKENVATAHSE